MAKNGGIIGVSDHGGWAVLITVACDGTLLDRRRVELVGEGLPKIPHHSEGQGLPLDEAVELVERVRVSAEKHAVWQIPAGAPNSTEVWAPEIHQIGGTFYIYYTAGTGAAHRMYVLQATTSDPTGVYAGKAAFTWCGRGVPSPFPVPPNSSGGARRARERLRVRRRAVLRGRGGRACGAGAA